MLEHVQQPGLGGEHLIGGSHLDAEVDDFSHFIHDTNDGGAVDTKRIVAHQGLPRQLEQNALVGWLW